jgi:molybdopterin molybdotransferase
MITVFEADRLLHEHLRPAGSERLALRTAHGRVLAERIAADRPYPPFHRVAMDGVAIAHAAFSSGLRRFPVRSTQRAGEAPHRLDARDSCIEIMTGAALPEGCDAVVRYEDLRINHGVAELVDRVGVEPWQNVHTAGSDASTGAILLDAGTRLLSTHMAAMASVGATEVLVSRQPRVAVLTTGDELVGPGDAVLPHQIRQSNGPAICAALQGSGSDVSPYVHVPDDEDALRTVLGEALDAFDVVLVTGGVSAGRFDFVPAVLAELGVHEVFHRVAQRPGKPFWFGVRPDGPAVFGLPGNPVSALVCVYRYLLPYIAASTGCPPARYAAWLREVPRRMHKLTLFAPAAVEGYRARVVPTNGSGDFLSLLPSDGFVEIPPEMTEQGDVRYYPWRGGC